MKPFVQPCLVSLELVKLTFRFHSLNYFLSDVDFSVSAHVDKLTHSILSCCDFFLQKSLNLKSNQKLNKITHEKKINLNQASCHYLFPLFFQLCLPAGVEWKKNQLLWFRFVNSVYSATFSEFSYSCARERDGDELHCLEKGTGRHGYLPPEINEKITNRLSTGMKVIAAVSQK